MSENILSDISKIYMNEVITPQLGKAKSQKQVSSKGSSDQVNKKPGESSEKKIRQAVYDIRYRARREEIPIQQAYSQYMSHTTMTGPEKSAVKSKLLGENKVIQEEEKKYKVRVTDKNSGKSYVRYATREKINQLRSNPNISSVEMTGYGDPYEGEKTKGEKTAAVKSGKGLAKRDYDGDGKIESGAKEYRGAVHNAIQRKKGLKPDGRDTSSVNEELSDWRSDLTEIVKDSFDKVKEKKIKNKIIINPDIKIEQAIENIGGKILEAQEIQLEGVLDEISDNDLYFLNDELIEEIVEEFLLECLEEGYDLDQVSGVLCESIDQSLLILNEVSDSYYDSAVKTSKRNAAKIRRAERSKKIKDTIGKVKSKIKSGIEKSKEIASKTKEVASSAAKKAGKAVGSAAQKAGKAVVSTAKKVGTAVSSASKSHESQNDNERSTSGNNGNSSVRTGRKRSGILSKVGSALKRGLKKAVGKTARFVAKGADKVASKLGEEVITEKSVSISQQQAAGAALAAKRGETSPSKLKGASIEMYKSMSEKQLRDFAKTKHKGLPEVKEAIVDQQTPSDDQVRSSQASTIRKQQLQNLKMINQKRQKLDLQKLQLQKQGKLPIEASFKPDGDLVNENEVVSEETPIERLDRISKEKVAQRAAKAASEKQSSQKSASQFQSFRKKHIAGGGTPVSALDAWQKKKMETNESLEVIDERRREEKGTPRKPRDRAMEIMRSMPSFRQGGMTRSGKTISQHEKERGVKKIPGSSTPKGETTADRLAKRKTQQAVAAKRAQDMYKPRAGESD